MHDETFEPELGVRLLLDPLPGFPLKQLGDWRSTRSGFSPGPKAVDAAAHAAVVVFGPEETPHRSARWGNR